LNRKTQVLWLSTDKLLMKHLACILIMIVGLSAYNLEAQVHTGGPDTDPSVERCQDALKSVTRMEKLFMKEMKRDYSKLDDFFALLEVMKIKSYTAVLQKSPDKLPMLCGDMEHALLEQILSEYKAVKESTSMKCHPFNERMRKIPLLEEVVSLYGLN